MSRFLQIMKSAPSIMLLTCIHRNKIKTDIQNNIGIYIRVWKRLKLMLLTAIDILDNPFPLGVYRSCGPLWRHQIVNISVKSLIGKPFHISDYTISKCPFMTWKCCRVKICFKSSTLKMPLWSTSSWTHYTNVLN